MLAIDISPSPSTNLQIAVADGRSVGMVGIDGTVVAAIVIARARMQRRCRVAKDLGRFATDSANRGVLSINIAQPPVANLKETITVGNTWSIRIDRTTTGVVIGARSTVQSSVRAVDHGSLATIVCHREMCTVNVSEAPISKLDKAIAKLYNTRDSDLAVNALKPRGARARVPECPWQSVGVCSLEYMLLRDDSHLYARPIAVVACECSLPQSVKHRRAWVGAIVRTTFPSPGW